MENTQKGFQALNITFTNPETGKQHKEFFVSLSSLSPQDFEQIFQSDNPVGESISIDGISQVFTFEDIAAYPEFKELLEALAEGMEESAG